MSQTRIVKNPATWVYIMKTDPTLLKDQNEFDFSQNTPSYAVFKEVISILTSSKLKTGFRLNLSNHPCSDKYDDNYRSDNDLYIKLIVDTLISRKFPINFELNLSDARLKDHDKKYLFTYALSSKNCPEGFLLNLTKVKYLTLRYFDNALRKCPARFWLILDQCGLDDNDILHLAKEIASDECRMQLLSLQNNRITNDGALAILAAIKRKDVSDLNIDLAGNNIDALILADIQKQLESNRNGHLCATMQKGLDCKASPLSKLPQALANHIYQYLVPLNSGAEISFFEKKLKSNLHKKEPKEINEEKAASACCLIL